MGDIQEAVLFNYMYDLEWMLDECPALATYPKVTIIHGERDGNEHRIKMHATPNMRIFRPPLPLPYGRLTTVRNLYVGSESNDAN